MVPIEYNIKEIPMYARSNQVKILNLFNIGTYNPQRENSKISPDTTKVSQKANQRTADVTCVNEATFKIIPMTAITTLPQTTMPSLVLR